MTPWAKLSLRLRAVINGIEFLDVVSWSATFELNNIPQAQLLLAVGRETTRQTAATIHQHVDGLKVKVPAQVYLKVERVSTSPGIAFDWPADEFIVFDGYAVGTGWTRNTSEAQFVVHLVHWLDDLHASSMLSATSHPSNPADFTFGAVFPALGVDGGGGADPNQGEPTWTATCDATRTISPTQLEEDLWGKVLFPWLTTIASQDRLDINPLGGAGVSRGLNDRAKKALARMQPGDRGAAPKVCRVVPLAMNLGGANGDAVANGLRTYLERETFSTWVHTTFWGKLVGEWGPQLMFSIAPRIEDAFPVPFTGPLRQHFITILGTEYNYSNVQSQLPQVLQAVGIMHPVEHNTGADMGPAAFPVSYAELCGWFNPSNEPEGMLLIKQAPGWIGQVIPSDQARASTGAEGEVVATAAEPGIGKPGPGMDPGKAVKGVANTDLMDRFAQHWYALETIKGRTGEISGMLRFDICPGTSIRVIAVPEKFLAKDKLAVPYFATVTRVSYIVNAEAGQCGTAFGLAHVRTEPENSSDKTSVAGPPLYKTPWTGCSLSNRF
jgi:hypothetical protein